MSQTHELLTCSNLREVQLQLSKNNLNLSSKINCPLRRKPISTIWVKWRLAFGVLCDKNVSSRLKGKFYRVVVTC